MIIKPLTDIFPQLPYKVNMGVKRNIMIDIETLGLNADAAIIEIAAVDFDKETGEIYHEIDLVIDRNDWDKRRIEASTVAFWMTNSTDEVRKKLFGNNVLKDKLDYALIKLSRFIQGDSRSIDDVDIWCEGTDFDIAILRNAYKQRTPWLYKNVNDLRTITHLCPWMRKYIEDTYGKTNHSAIDDCKRQIKILVGVLKCIKVKKEEELSKEKARYIRIMLPIYDFHDDRDIPDVIPFRKKGTYEDIWEITIDLKEHRIVDWPKDYGGAEVRLKVMDGGRYTLLDEEQLPIKSFRGYVPNDALPPKDGCGDYIEFDIDGLGYVVNFYKKPDFHEFYGKEND